MTRRLTQLALILLLTLASSAHAQETNFFPVMTWDHVPADLTVLKKIHDCGFTIAGFASPNALKLCQKAGLMAIVTDPRITEPDWTKLDDATIHRNVVSLVKEVGKNSAVYGYFLQDEPSAALFPGMAKAASILREVAPGKWPYINLYPNYAVPDQMGTATYLEYLQQFCDKCHPPILSYDHYAIMDDGSLRDGFWQNLEQIRHAARKNSLPFWSIVLSVAHYNYREASAADLRFEVYTSLAYGARGITYYLYFSPNVGNYRMAPIDQFGNPTATWGYMQNINLQIGKLGPTLLQLTSDDVYHFANVPKGCHGPTTNDLLASVDGGDFMAGDFTHANGSRYVMIVNKSVSKSAFCSPHFRPAPRTLQMVSPYSGALAGYSADWLAPGQGVLLKVD